MFKIMCHTHIITYGDMVGCRGHDFYWEVCRVTDEDCEQKVGQLRGSSPNKEWKTWDGARVIRYDQYYAVPQT